MYKGQFIFTQLCQFLPKRAFDCLVDKYEGNKYVKSFSCWNHLLVLVFGQLSCRESMRDLITTITPYHNFFHHLGFGKSVTRSNLSKANEIREVRIFEEYADKMVRMAREKRTGMKDFFINNKVYAFDSSTISLCLSVYWWTKLHHGKSGIKMHTLYDVQTDIPVLTIITGADLHDSQVMDRIPYEGESFYVFDRAYMDTKQLIVIEKANAYFVVREKHRIKYEVVLDKNYNNPSTGVMADMNIRFTGNKTKHQYPKTLRRIVLYDKEGNRTFVFYTNNLSIEAEKVALLYCYRWRVELFFKWMKQHLRIKEFYGTSENAVKIQIYSAVIAYCLVAIVEKDLHVKISTYKILRILTMSLLVKMPLAQLFKESQEAENDDDVLFSNSAAPIQMEIPFAEW